MSMHPLSLSMHSPCVSLTRATLSTMLHIRTPFTNRFATSAIHTLDSDSPDYMDQYVAVIVPPSWLGMLSVAWAPAEADLVPAAARQTLQQHSSCYS